MPIPEEKTRRQVDLDMKAVEWFETNYSANRLSWICNLLLNAFVAIHTKTPLDLAKDAGRMARKMIAEQALDIGEEPPES